MELEKFYKKGYFLENGEKLHRENPETFLIPDLELRCSVLPGAIVKLIFNMLENDKTDETSVERMWVVVKSVDNGFYVGTLDNDPYGNVSIKCGDEVVFGAEHIIDIYED